MNSSKPANGTAQYRDAYQEIKDAPCAEGSPQPRTRAPTRSMERKCSSNVSTVEPLRAAQAATQMSLVGRGVPRPRSATQISAQIRATV